MEIPRVHTITQIRPKSDRNSQNSTAFDYKNAPVFTVSLEGLFQTRTGRFIPTEEGQGYSYDAVFYVPGPIVQDVKNHDVFKVKLPGVDGNFRVVGVEPKYTTLGEYNHARVALTKDSAVIV